MKYQLIFALLLLSIKTLKIVHAQNKIHQLTTPVSEKEIQDKDAQQSSLKISQSTEPIYPSVTTDKNKELLKQSLMYYFKKENFNITEKELNQKVELYLKYRGDELLKIIQDQKNNRILKSTIGGVAAGATPFVINAISSSIISAFGFTSGGVAAGSIATGVQAGLGGIIAQGGTFALLQSVGATGAGIFGATFGLPLVISGLAIGAGVAAYLYFF